MAIVEGGNSGHFEEGHGCIGCDLSKIRHFGCRQIDEMEREFEKKQRKGLPRKRTPMNETPAALTAS